MPKTKKMVYIGKQLSLFGSDKVKQNKINFFSEKIFDIEEILMLNFRAIRLIALKKETALKLFKTNFFTEEDIKKANTKPNVRENNFYFQDRIVIKKNINKKIFTFCIYPFLEENAIVFRKTDVVLKF